MPKQGGVLRWSPLAAVVLFGSLACLCFGEDPPAPDTGSPGPGPVGEVEVKPAGPPPLVNPKGQTIVDTLIDRADSRAYFPLSEGIDLSYEEAESRGDGDRVLFMTDRPAGSEKRGEWRFVVTGFDETADPPVYTATLTKPSPPPEDIDDADDRTPTTVDLRLWVDAERVKVQGPFGIKDAVALSPGPPVVASEEVRCTLWILGGVETVCRAIGGTGGTTVGPSHIFLDSDNDLGNAVSRTFIGIVTLGTVIPASKRRTWTLHSTRHAGITPEREMPAFYRAWSDAMPKGESVDVLHELSETHPPDAASLAAIVASDPVHLEARALASMQVLPAHHRAPVLRRAVRTLPEEEPRTRMLLAGHLDAAIASVPETHKESIVGLLNEAELRTAQDVASGDCPALEAALREPNSVSWGAAVSQHIGASLDRAPCDEAAYRATGLLGSRSEVLEHILAAQSEEAWFPRFQTALEQAYAEDRVPMLKRHQKRLSSRTEAEREALLAVLRYDGTEDEARKVLGLPQPPP